MYVYKDASGGFSSTDVPDTISASSVTVGKQMLDLHFYLWSVSSCIWEITVGLCILFPFIEFCLVIMFRMVNRLAGAFCGGCVPHDI